MYRKQITLNFQITFSQELNLWTWSHIILSPRVMPASICFGPRVECHGEASRYAYDTFMCLLKGWKVAVSECSKHFIQILSPS